MAKDLSNLEPSAATRVVAQPQYPAVNPTRGMTPAQVYGAPGLDPVEVAKTWLAALGRKAEEQDLLNEPVAFRNRLITGATEYLRGYTGDFDYLVQLQGTQRSLRRGQVFPTVRQAKGILNCLRAEVGRQERSKAQPAGQPAPARLQVEDAGVYRLPDGTICKVQVTRDKARTYAKRLTEIGGQRATEGGTRVHAEYVYEAGLVQRVAAEGVKLSLAEAKALTIRYGFCIRCGRHLTDAHSVEQGMGPVCIRYFS
jgi:hypothetical protein